MPICANWLSHSVITRSRAGVRPPPAAACLASIRASARPRSRKTSARDRDGRPARQSPPADIFARRRRTPDQRHAHQRVDVIRPLVDQAEVALQLAVVGGEEHVGVAHPIRARRRVASTRPQASSMSSFSTWTIALISRTWSCVIWHGTKFHGPPSLLRKRPSYQSSQWRGFCARIFSIFSREPGWPGGRSRSRQLIRRASRRGRIPRMMRIGKAHPHEPVFVGGRASQEMRWCDRRPSRCDSARAGSDCS